MGKKRLHVIVSGRVQGVFFRASTQETARGLALTGWVKNLDDGRVEALFEGGEGALLRMLEWCRRGPPGALPGEVKAQWSGFTGEFPNFRVLYR